MATWCKILEFHQVWMIQKRRLGIRKSTSPAQQAWSSDHGQLPRHTLEAVEPGCLLSSPGREVFRLQKNDTQLRIS